MRSKRLRIQSHCFSNSEPSSIPYRTVFLSVNTSSVNLGNDLEHSSVYKYLGEIGPEEYLLEPGAALSTSQRGPCHRPFGQGKQEPSTQMLGIMGNV
jgi:hypothetical protein